VPPPNYLLLTCCCSTRPWVAHQADGVVAMHVHPVQRHEREEVADMEGGSGRVNAHVGADGLVGEQPVERLPSAVVG
jgi:hypothetical protein